MKTNIIIKKDCVNGNYKEKELGYIDGYIRGGNDSPYAVVVLGDKLTLVPFVDIKVLK